MPLPQLSPGVYWDKPRAVTTADGVEIRYTILLPATPPPQQSTVCLLSGFLCPDTWWHELVPALTTAGHRVVLLHYRGIATSGVPEEITPDTVSIERFAADAVDVLHAAGVAEVSLIGHSMGGQVLLEVGRRISSRVRSMATVTGAYRAPTKDLYGAGWFFDPFATLVTRAAGLGPMAPVGAAWKTAWTLLPFGRTLRTVRAFGPEAPDDILASYADHARQMQPEMVLATTEALHRHDPGDVLEALDIPMLVITGTKDPFTPVRVAKQMVRRMPNAHLEVVDGATHALLLERPAQVNALLLKHLGEHHPLA